MKNSSGRLFPVLRDLRIGRDHPNCPRYIFWASIEPHEEQAKQNHCGQTLEELALRGGLSPQEIYYIMRDMPFQSPPIEEGKAIEALPTGIGLLSTQSGE